MRKLEVYECSYSGKRFDSKKECLEYEKVEHISHINRQIRILQRDKVQSSFIKSIKNMDNLYNIDKLFVNWEREYNSCNFEIESYQLGADSLSNKTTDRYNVTLENLKYFRYDYGFFIRFKGKILHYPFIVHYQSMYHGVYQTFKFIYNYFHSERGPVDSNLLFRPDGLFIFDTRQARFKEEPVGEWNVNLEKGDPTPKFDITLFLPFEFVPHIGAKNLLLGGIIKNG